MVDLRTQTVECLQQVLTANNTTFLPRHDYREACELALVMLNVQPARWNAKDRWYAPGATSNARWMTMLLYAPKMLAFHCQMEEFDDEYIRKLEKFVAFTSYVYIQYWIRASIGRDAPVLDLTLYKELLTVQDIFPEIVLFPPPKD